MTSCGVGSRDVASKMAAVRGIGGKLLRIVRCVKCAEGRVCCRMEWENVRGRVWEGVGGRSLGLVE